MKTMARWIPALVLVLLAAATSAPAQIRSESWELGPYFLWSGFDGSTEIADDWGGGFRFGYNFIPMHELEFSFSQVDTEDNVFHDIDVRVGQFQTNYNFNFAFHPHQMVIPYMALGLGAIRFHVKTTESVAGGIVTVSDEETDPTFVFGGGVRFFVNKKFNVRLDGRWISYTGDNVVLRNVGFTNFDFSAGVGWVLGGR
jgi:opacity protein-like surface antigen